MFFPLLGLLFRAARLLLCLLLHCCSRAAIGLQQDALEEFVSKQKIFESWRFPGAKLLFFPFSGKKQRDLLEVSWGSAGSVRTMIGFDRREAISAPIG
jgi:hypothetical protein